jgi:Na+-driven multidrug efflux pump
MPKEVLVANLTTLSLIQNVQMTMYTLAVGFLIYTRTIINSFIGKNDPKKSREIFFKCYKVNIIISVLVALFIYFGLSLACSMGIFESEEVQTIFKASLFWSAIHCATSFHSSVMNMGLKSIGRQMYMIIVNNSFVIIFVLGGVYYGLKKGYGVIGVVAWVAASRLVKLLMHIAVVYYRDWEEVGRYGVKREQEKDEPEINKDLNL